MDKVRKWFFEDEYEDFDDFDEEMVEDEEEENKNKLNANKDSNLVLFEPRSYSETQDIALYLKQKKAAVVNLHRLQKEQSKRVIDFLSGVIYAIDGDIQQIGPKIFLCTPKNIAVSGNISLDDEEVSNN